MSTQRIYRVPSGLPYTVSFAGGRAVTYLWHRITDSYSVWIVEGEVSPEEIAEGEASLRALALEADQ